jgi:ATP-dependent Lhr-like helicase
VVEDRTPYLNSWDVLVQYLNTLAVSDGFLPTEIFGGTRHVLLPNHDTRKLELILNFISNGSQSLQAYDEYKKVEIDENGCFRITNRRIAMQHRMQIGTIVGDAVLNVKFMSGGYIGTIEEWFISKLKPGDTFSFAGKKLEYFRVKDMQVLVRKADPKKESRTVSWMGGRMTLSAQMSELLRQELYAANSGNVTPELRALAPLFKRQRKESIVPDADEFLIETFKTREGHHAVFYPFEGRFVHEALASVMAYRISFSRRFRFLSRTMTTDSNCCRIQKSTCKRCLTTIYSRPNSCTTICRKA